MSDQVNFVLPEQQNATIQIPITPPISISGWTIQVDLMRRFFSPQPIVSLYLASGFSNGQSGITLIDGANGIFNLSLTPLQVSGLSLTTNVLAYQAYRTDLGSKTPIVGGFRLLVAF